MGAGVLWAGEDISRQFGLVCALAMLAACAEACAAIPSRSDGPRKFPAYVAAGIVQAATQTAEPLAPNTIATLYGSKSFLHNLCGDAGSDVHNEELPTSKLGGVTVLVNGIPCNMFYVSPGQINFLTPYEITASSIVVAGGTAGVRRGLAVTIPMAVTAPAFFEWNGNLAIGEHTDGRLADLPAGARTVRRDRCALRRGIGPHLAGSLLPARLPSALLRPADSVSRAAADSAERQPVSGGQRPLCRAGAGLRRSVSNQPPAAGKSRFRGIP